MILYRNNKMVIVFPFLLKKIDSGTQGIVYKYRGKALKVPYNHDDIFDTDFDLSTSDCEYLKGINTKRILLPEDSLTDRTGDLRAYILERITTNENDRLCNISKDKFIDELYALRKEIILLSENNVTVNDMNMGNFMYDGMFRFVDCGRYGIDYQNIGNPDVIKRITNENNKRLQNFVITDLIIDMGDNCADTFEKVQKEISSLGCSFIGDYIEKTMDRHDTLIEYVKKKAL